MGDPKTAMATYTFLWNIKYEESVKRIDNYIKTMMRDLALTMLVSAIMAEEVDPWTTKYSRGRYTDYITAQMRAQHTESPAPQDRVDRVTAEYDRMVLEMPLNRFKALYFLYTGTLEHERVERMFRAMHTQTKMLELKYQVQARDIMVELDLTPIKPDVGCKRSRPASFHQCDAMHQ